MNSVLRFLVKPFAPVWRRYSRGFFSRLPRPTGDTSAHAPGPDADRILIVGSGIAVGFGALSHDLSLAGHLARRISELTRRGARVDVVARPELRVRDVASALAGVRLSRFDVIVLAFGIPEAATLMARRSWRRDLKSALSYLQNAGVAAHHVFVVGVPDLRTIRGPYGSLVRVSTASINSESRAACAERAAVTYLPMDGDDSLSTSVMSRVVYDRWALRLAVPMSAVLDELAPGAPVAEPVDESSRQDAVDALPAPSPTQAHELDEILATARNLFGVSAAAVNIIDGNLQQVRAASGTTSDPVERDDSMCSVTIASRDVLVVSDTQLDPRSQNMTWVQPPSGIRFYAGYPIEGPGGERVGALCILDSEPRSFSRADGALLRELALRAQSVLWKQTPKADDSATLE